MRCRPTRVWFLAIAMMIPCSRTSFSYQDPYGDFVAKSEPKTPAEEQKCFHLPPGFEIQLVAAEPDIRKPINMNFDARGRLWVTQSTEYPFPAQANRTGRDLLKILEDIGEDGKAKKTLTYAEGFNIPIGVLPLKSGALVYSIPNVYHVWASEGGDHADKREVYYSTFGFEDTHGMSSSFTWGFDGWVYGCHGFSNTSTLKGKDGVAVTMNSGNTYRMKPDGSHVEQFTHGQVNPFGLCFDPLGNLYSADCHTKPIMMLLRGGYYQSFGKPHDGLGYAPEMCFHDHGSTALCGIVYYAATDFPEVFRDNIFVGNVVTNRVNRDKLERHGSTYTAIEQPDFLTCDDPWFRPVDLKLGPDGAIYVADFYNRIIGHYEVPLTHPGRDRERGRIWRIIPKKLEGSGPGKRPTMNWATDSAKDLVVMLHHSNLTRRMAITNELVQRGGDEVVSAVKNMMLPKPVDASIRLHGLWTLERLHALDDKIFEKAIHDEDYDVRTHAMKVLAERPTLTSQQQRWAQKALRDPDAFVQRAAAEALSTHPSVENIHPLLVLRHAVPSDDTHLLYMVRMSLRNQLADPKSWDKLNGQKWTEADHRALADVAAGFADGRASEFLLTFLKQVPSEKDDLPRYLHHIGRYGSQAVDAAAVQMIREKLGPTDGDRAALLNALYEGTSERGRPMSPPQGALARFLARRLVGSDNTKDVIAGLGIVNFAKLKEMEGQVARLAANRTAAFEEARRVAIDSLNAINLERGTFVLRGVLMNPSEPMILRKRTARILGGINRPDAQSALLECLQVAPAELQDAIAGALAANAQGAEKLLNLVLAGKASERLLWEWGVNIRLTKHAKIRDRLAKLTGGPSPADQRLQELMKRRRSGFVSAKTDPTHGVTIFEKNCAICHQIAGKGAKVGPQLDGIGNRGVDRLLEDIIDPNRNVDQAFRSTVLTLKSGQIMTGLLLREEGEIYVMADPEGKEVRVAKSDVEERTISQLSPMPANLVDQIPEAEFYNLMAYLLSLRPAVPQKTQ
jgi:putative heme-binding domain-containing protein